MFTKHLNKSLSQRERNLNLSVMQAKQGPQEFNIAGNQLCGDTEYIAENEVLGGVVAHAIRRRLVLGLKKRIQQAPVEFFDDRIAQIGKELAKVEGEFSSGLQQIIRQ